MRLHDGLDLAMPGCTVEAPAIRWQDQREEAFVECVAEEIPVAIEYNGISHAVMMATPADLEDFGLGFSLTEDILRHRGELFDCDVVVEEEGIRLALSISSERFLLLKDRRRNLTGRTGCGLCGTESLAQAVRAPAPVRSTATFSMAALGAGMDEMAASQTLRRATGATHAAAWLDACGRIAILREDVGRHNALDKLIGALSRARIDTTRGAVIVTSRASYEMVQKSVAAGIGMLASISAPTALAIRLAEQSGLTLVRLARQGRHVVYTHSSRMHG